MNTKPIMVRGSGPHLVERWVMEQDGTRYEAIVVHGIEPSPTDIGQGEEYALICVNVGGGASMIHGFSEARFPRWNITGGGAWYEFAAEGFLTWTYVAEKFRLNKEEAGHVTRLIGAALNRPVGVAA